MPTEEPDLLNKPLSKREMAEKDVILSAQNLYIEYDGHVLLKNLFLPITYGSTVSIRGDVGIGKSSLLRVLGLLSTPQSGNVYLSSSSKRFITHQREGQKALKVRDYYDCAALPHPEREDIIKTYFAYIFQSHELMMQWDALENISLPLFARGFSAHDRLRHAKALCRQLDITSIMNKPMYQLSGGQRQLVNIARALAKEPTILIADEPTSSLDPDRKLMVFNLFTELATKKNMTVIAATHNVSAITHFDEHYIIENKKLREHTEENK